MHGVWPMSQRDVEGLLGRLIVDAALRERFFEYPEEVVLQEIYDVSPRELTALLRIDEAEVLRLAAQLKAILRVPPSDDRESRATVRGPG